METHAKTDLPPSATITGLWSLVGPLLHAQRYKFLLVVATLPVGSVMAMLTPYLTMVAIDKYIVPAARTGNLEAVYEPLLQLIMWAAGVVIAGYLADAIYVSTLQRTGQT
ncbi:MAG: hypothetical protein V3S29_05560, partial [bacterium]